jgi:hypothetical protein
MSADRDLFLHEYIDINGMHQWDYMEHTLQQSGDEKVEFELLGTWYTMGITARWPQVVNVWEIDGWDGWARLAQRTNVDKAANAALAAWWDEAHTRRTGGFDRLLRGAPGCPSRASLAADDVHGTWFVHELSHVRPGAGAEYLAATHDQRTPAMAERGIRLVGLYEGVLTDTEVCTIWATDVGAHTALLRDGDPWRALARRWCTRWREELMTPGPRSPLGPPEDRT